MELGVGEADVAAAADADERVFVRPVAEADRVRPQAARKGYATKTGRSQPFGLNNHLLKQVGFEIAD